MTEAKKIKICDILFVTALLGTLCLLLWKSQYGYAMGDESYYSGLVYRIVRGDTLLVHERHRTQLFALLLYPFVSTFVNITGGTEGIVVAVRYLYIVILLTSAALFYLRIKKYSPLGALLSTCLMLLYIPNQIMSVSYYTLGIIFTGFTGASIAFPAKHPKLNALLGGACYAGAVLCNPLLVALIPVFIIMRVIYAKKKERKFLSKNDIYPVLGIVLLALPYMYHLLSSSGIEEIIGGIAGVLKSRTDLVGMPLWKIRLKVLFGSITTYKSLAAYFVYTAVVLAAIIIDKKRHLHRAIYATVSFVVYSGLCFWLQKGSGYINFAILPFVFIGIIAYSLTENKKTWQIAPFWIISAVHFVCIAYGSDQGFLAAVVGLFPAGVGGALAISDFLHETWAKDFGIKSKSVAAGAALLAGVTICVLAYDMSTGLYWDLSPNNLTAEITDGPMKGIKTTPEKREDYYYMYEQTEPVRNAPGERVLYQTINEWLWLCDDKMPGTQSIWTMELNIQEDYFKEHPECIPDVVYIQYTFGEPEQIADFIGAKVEEFTETETGYVYIRNS